MEQKRLFFLIAILSVGLIDSLGPTSEELTGLVIDAVQDGDTKKLRLLIWKGADINASDERGKTLLEVALLYGQEDMAKYLIAKGFDVNKKNARGITPLGFAVGRPRDTRELPDAKDSHSYCERGHYFSMQDQPNRAVEDYTSAIRLNPQNDTAYYCRGRAWAEINNPQQAVADWKKAIELDWRNALHVHYGRRLLKSADPELNRLIEDTIMKNLEDLEVVSGYAVGIGGSPGDFYTVSLIISSPFDEERFLPLAQSNNPVVRAMAMICLVRENKSKYKETINAFYTDTAEVEYMPMGCLVERTTLGKLAKSMIDDPNVLDYWAAAHTDGMYSPSETESKREDAIQWQIRIIRSLIAKGAQINLKDQHGETPLHHAAEHGSTRIAEFLIANGADVNAKNSKGETALHCATFWGYRQIIELLIAHGADINAKTNEGQTAMDIATQQDYPGLSTLLRESGQAQSYRSDSTGEIARKARNYATLHQAVRSGDIEIIRWFIANGADVNEKNYWPGETVLHVAAYEGRKDIAEVLIASGANVNAKSRQRTMGTKVTAGDRTPLHHAAARGHKDVAELLIAKGANVNAKDLQRPGNMPLHNAIHRHYADVVELLVSKGADVNAPNDEGDTPLHLAAFGGCRDIAEMLIAAGAQVNPVDQSGWTPLHKTTYNGHTDIAELLLAKGANRYTKNKRGRIALDYARVAGFRDIVKLLGGDVNAQGFGDRSPYSVIITEQKAVKEFLRSCGIEFDDVWIPEEKDVKGLESVFESYLDKNRVLDVTTYFDREYVLSRFRRYNREYSGFVRDGAKYIVCSMHCFGGEYNMFVAEVFSKEPNGNKFTIIADGGSGVVRVIYDFPGKTVIHVDANPSL
ncbi:MAG: ankyrin repeat domain-containing protein [Planctomycetota bacterium]|jgi:ankyrin repeat protein